MMDTITIRLMDPKALKLLEDMEEKHLVEILKEPSKISSLRGLIKKPMSSEEIDKQLNEIRNEWQRDF